MLDRHGQANYTQATLKAHLMAEVRTGHWHEWVRSSQTEPSEVDLAMSKGPELTLTVWNKMEVQGTTILSKRVEGNSKGACDSLVLTWPTEKVPNTNPVQEITTPFVGQVQAFYTQEPPWAVGDFEQRQAVVAQIADVKWFEYKGSNANVYNAPVYSRSFKPELNGDFWACERLEAVPIILGPYVGSQFTPRASLQQVLVQKVAVFKPEIEYEVHEDIVQGVAP